MRQATAAALDRPIFACAAAVFAARARTPSALIAVRTRARSARGVCEEDNTRDESFC